MISEIIEEWISGRRVRRLFFLPVPTHLEPSIDGDRIKYSPTSANVREKP